MPAIKYKVARTVCSSDEGLSDREAAEAVSVSALTVARAAETVRR